MKSTVVLLLASVALLSSCRIHDQKDGKVGPEDKTSPTLVDGKTGSALLAASLSLEEVTVYKGDTITVSWSSEDGATCELKANGQEIGKKLVPNGSRQHTPDADTSYELTCTRNGMVGTAVASLKSLTESDVTLPMLKKTELSSILDLSSLAGDECPEGKPCFFADLEPEFFKKADTGWTVTDAFAQQLKDDATSYPAPRIVTLEQMNSTFDLSSSIVYGAQDRLGEIGLDEICKEAEPKANGGAPLGGSVTLYSPTESGSEELSKGLLNVAVFTDLTIMGKERHSIITKGSNLTVSFKNADMVGQMSATYQEYTRAEGKFIAAHSGPKSRHISLIPGEISMFRVEPDDVDGIPSLLSGTFRKALVYPPVPEGYVLPARGYGGDDKAFIPTDLYCNVKRQLVQPHMFAPPVWYGPVSDYFPQIASKRIVQGPGTIQCNEINIGDALVYSIGPEWKLDKPDAWYFVVDRNWPSCGGFDCLGKELITNNLMSPSWNIVEPEYNFCIDRFAGLNYSDYLFRIIDACREMDVYKTAVKKAQETADDIAFYRKCVGSDACQAVPFGLSDLQSDYPLEKSKLLLDISKKQLDNARSGAQSLLFDDPRFSKASLNRGQKTLQKVRENFAIYENLRTSVAPTVNGLIRYMDIVPMEFSSSEQILKSLDDYEALFKSLAALSQPSAETVGCSFNARGKFRRYIGMSVNNVEITPLRKITQTRKILRDFKISN